MRKEDKNAQALALQVLKALGPRLSAFIPCAKITPERHPEVLPFANLPDPGHVMEVSCA
ncbi:hypothetical protein GCM10008938_19330 [Deinococcus roseus]|uniref:Uncharacterized protein n=1 Tax=Deinococcus roseus TaxID=392414 RepID=A0ABQ2CYJ3_9DEIO|nr:hypothetical protein GCM10008938_19330 [Deinococcus roseus]